MCPIDFEPEPVGCEESGEKSGAVAVADPPGVAEVADVAEAAVDYDDQVVGVAVADSMPTDNVDAHGKQLHKAIVDLPSPAMRSPDAATTLAKISEAAEEVREWREKLALLKDETKEAKENLQGAVNRLMRLSAAVANDASRPLFAAVEANETKAEAEIAPAASSDSPSPSATPIAESWRSFRFDDPNHFPSLASQKAIVAKLAAEGLETIGQLVDYQKPTGENGHCKTLTDIKGIGTGKAEKIENALEHFWAEHPELIQEAVDAA